MKISNLLFILSLTTALIACNKEEKITNNNTTTAATSTATPTPTATATATAVPTATATATSLSTTTTFAGSDGVFGVTDGTGTDASFGLNLNAITAGPDGTLYVADTANHCIRKITKDKVVTVYAGSNSGVAGNTEGIGTAARFNSPRGLAADALGNVWVADTGNCCIRKIPTGALTTTSVFSGICGTCATGAVGAQATARYNHPRAITIDFQGNLYVADTGNILIRKIPTILATVGTSVAFAGVANTVGSADGAGASATFSTITDLVTDNSLNVYIVDSGNNLIRKATSAGVVTTIAGVVGNSGSQDGTGTAVRFNNPAGIAISNSGTLYITDEGNNLVRKMTSSGTVTTIAGQTGTIGSTNGTSQESLFSSPSGIVVTSSGTLYITDKGNYLIRAVVP